MLRSALNIQDEGNILDDLGLKITQNLDGTITLTQPHIIGLLSFMIQIL